MHYYNKVGVTATSAGVKHRRFQRQIKPWIARIHQAYRWWTFNKRLIREDSYHILRSVTNGDEIPRATLGFVVDRRTRWAWFSIPGLNYSQRTDTHLFARKPRPHPPNKRCADAMHGGGGKCNANMQSSTPECEDARLAECWVDCSHFGHAPRTVQSNQFCIIQCRSVERFWIYGWVKYAGIL